MKRLINQLSQQKVIISDGAWGTSLQAKGLSQGECPESWNLSHRDDVKAIAQSYFDAGASLIKTNSFGGSSFKLKNFQLDHKVFEINKAAAEISKEVVTDKAFVLGSVGPSGKIIMMGDVSAEELYESFKEQCKGLETGGADAILVETMSDLEEALYAVRAAKENTDCTIICTMTFEKTVDGTFRSMFGVSPTDMVEPLINAGADIIGANCGNGMEGMIEITKEIRRVNPHVPICIHANAGLPQMIDGETVFPESPEHMASLLPLLTKAGAQIVGGCCGTTPSHIKKIEEVAAKLCTDVVK